MPFVSKDWRSPGEKWIRYNGGWEMKKTVWNVSHQSNHHHGFTFDLQVHETGESLDDSGSESSPMEVGSWDSSYSLSPSSSPVNHSNFKEPVSKVSLLKKCFTLTKEAVKPNDNDVKHLNRELHLPQMISQPYYNITIKSTREIAGFNGLAEAFLRLDFLNAVKDIRRFNYVSKIMYKLFSHDRLSQLSGAAQKVLFRMLEEMADMVYKNNVNQHVLRKLLDELHATLSIYHVWGTHLGSKALFKQHVESKRKITEMVEKMQVTYKQDLATPAANLNRDSSPVNKNGLINSLPEECIREILLRLSDPKDVERAGDTCLTMSTIAREKRVWRELVQTHFTKQQIEFIMNEKADLRGHKDWKIIYKALRWRFGLKEDYTEVLMLCRKCRVLFWQSLGHPCLVREMNSSGSEDDEDSQSVQVESPVSPNLFLSFFSV